MLDTRQHLTFRRTLPILRTLAHNVALIHPDQVGLAILVDDLSDEVVACLDEEEDELYVDLELEPVPPRVGAEVAKLQEAHARIARRLRDLRDVADNYVHPPWAGPAYRVLLDGLAAFEADVLRHQRYEERVLLDRFVTRS